MRAPRLIVAVLVIATVAGCVSRRIPLPPDAPAAACRTLESSDPTLDNRLAWREVTDEQDRLAMAESCLLVGPAVYWSPPEIAAGRTPLRISAIAVVSWNVHVGGGDVGVLIDALREGRFTNGRRVERFVMLVQEAYRSGRLVPPVGETGIRVPRRIAPTPRSGSRRDILEVARTRRLSVFYLPSMRNGPEEGPAGEHRGNAILSTFALSDLTGIELPFERQRRVAAAATLTVVDDTGTSWPIRLVSAHLNATASMRRLWVFAAGARAGQARHLARALDDNPVPTVVGIDLNTWAGGWSEPAFEELRSRFRQTVDPSEASGFGQRRRLDYVFLRGPETWSMTLRAIEDRYGSDHRPVLAWIELNPVPSRSPLSRF